jgi:hypothetical protein
MPRDETKKKSLKKEKIVNLDKFSKPRLIFQTNNSWNLRPELNFQQIECGSMTSEKKYQFKKNFKEKNSN